MDVAPIRSERLDLVSMGPAVIGALLDGRHTEAEQLLGATLPAGWPDERDEGFLRLRFDQMQQDPASQEWLIRALVLRGPRAVTVGHAGFHGEPGVNGPGKARAVEVGYTIFPEHRRQGYATEAVVALMDWARGRGIDHFIASVAPDNEPSLAVVRKLGFVQTGDQWDDEDGLELVFELDGNTK